MPTFEYRCTQCKIAFERESLAIPGPSLMECPVCGLLSGIRQRAWPVDSAPNPAPPCVSPGSSTVRLMES